MRVLAATGCDTDPISATCRSSSLLVTRACGWLSLPIPRIIPCRACKCSDYPQRNLPRVGLASYFARARAMLFALTLLPGAIVRGQSVRAEQKGNDAMSQY